MRQQQNELMKKRLKQQVRIAIEDEDKSSGFKSRFSGNSENTQKERYSSAKPKQKFESFVEKINAERASSQQRGPQNSRD